MTSTRNDLGFELPSDSKENTKNSENIGEPPSKRPKVGGTESSRVQKFTSDQIKSELDSVSELHEALHVMEATLDDQGQEMIKPLFSGDTGHRGEILEKSKQLGSVVENTTFEQENADDLAPSMSAGPAATVDSTETDAADDERLKMQ